MEQYKLYIEMADRISARRATTNNTFWVGNTAILTALATLASKADAGLVFLWLAIGLAIGGLVICIGWALLIASYAAKSNAKGAVHNAIERSGYVPLKLFSAEHRILHRRKWYRGPACMEYSLPAGFALIYLVAWIWLGLAH